VVNDMIKPILSANNCWTATSLVLLYYKNVSDEIWFLFYVAKMTATITNTMCLNSKSRQVIHMTFCAVVYIKTKADMYIYINGCRIF